jgi:hypothetical protein
VVTVLKQAANQYSCLAESKSLVIKSCSESINHSSISKKIIRPFGLLKTFSDNETEGRLEYIKANFGCLPSNITQLQEKVITLKNPIDLVRKTENAMENVASDIDKLMSSKINGVLKENTGYKAMHSISRVLMGEEFSITEIREELTSCDLVYFKCYIIVNLIWN